MSTPQSKRPSELQIDEDLPFQARQWKVQRTGWWLLAVFILAGLAGALGRGPLSRAQAGSETVLHIEYERFVRRESPTTLRIQVAPAAHTPNEMRLAISREYLKAMRIESVTPEPRSMHLTASSIIYSFAVEPKARAEIILEVSPREMGRHRGFIRLAGTPDVTFSQLAYP